MLAFNPPFGPWKIVEEIINIVFAINVIITFKTAFYDFNYDLVTSKRVIYLNLKLVGNR
jgi:hypothetical protein